jgi:hypothetical protein
MTAKVYGSVMTVKIKKAKGRGRDQGLTFGLASLNRLPCFPPFAQNAGMGHPQPL